VPGAPAVRRLPLHMDSRSRFSSQLREGIDLFNAGSFYECHDAIEEIWIQESSDRQPLLQGLIQSAVAFHHYQHRRYGAARAMLDLAIRKLEHCPLAYQGIQVSEFLAEIRRWKAALDELVTSGGKVDLSFPRIEIT